MEKGQEVKIKKEFQDEGDAEFTFIVVEDRGDRVLVSVEDCLNNIEPQIVLLKEHLEA